MYEHDRARLLELLKKHSFERKEVVLSSGEKSDFYIDCKKTLLMGEGHLLAARLMYRSLLAIEVRLGFPIEAVAGVELGGCSLASALSTVAAIAGRELPAIYVRKTPKDHGTKAELEGPNVLDQVRKTGLLGGVNVILVEDVITSGKSALEAAQKIARFGYQVPAVLAVVDRDAGGIQAIKKYSMLVEPIYTLREFGERSSS